MMSIAELLQIISKVAKTKGTSEPFIVGGLPRDKYLGRINEIQDIDLTTGDESISVLAISTAQVLVTTFPDLNLKVYPDGHAQIDYQGIKIDFSSNYRAPQAIGFLKSLSINNPSDMLVELISRDFTCNTLLMTMDLKRIKDPLGTSINDLNEKIIKTPMPAKYTLTNDPKRVVRVVYLATKLGFTVDQDIIDFVKSDPSIIARGVKEGFLKNKINESLEKDPQKTVDLLTEMNVWKYIPITENLMPYASGRI